MSRSKDKNLWIVVADTGEYIDTVDIQLFGVFSQTGRAHLLARHLDKKYEDVRILPITLDEECCLYLGGNIC